MERSLCSCRGADARCDRCGGTGYVDEPKERIRGTPWLVNVYVPENVPYYVCVPTSHVRCRYCGRRIKRRKIWDHVRADHPDQQLTAQP